MYIQVYFYSLPFYYYFKLCVSVVCRTNTGIPILIALRVVAVAQFFFQQPKKIFFVFTGALFWLWEDILRRNSKKEALFVLMTE